MNFSIRISSDSLVLVGCFGMCLQTYIGRKWCRGSETREAECDGKTWLPETKWFLFLEKVYPSNHKKNKVLKPFFDRCFMRTYFGLPVAMKAYTTAERRWHQPAEGKFQERHVLPKEAHSHQWENAAVCKNRDLISCRNRTSVPRAPFSVIQSSMLLL